MLIIVEGADGAGKSTLVTELRAALEREHPHDRVMGWKKGPPTSRFTHPLDEYELPLLSYRPGTGAHIICDRWHWGEWIYPDLLKRPTNADRPSWYHIELFLQSRGAFTVFLNPPVQTLSRRVWIRGDEVIHPDQLERLSFSYTVMHEQAIAPTLELKDVPSDSDVEAILYAARIYERFARDQLRDLVTYVGDSLPNVIYVGDVRKTGTAEEDLRPAFMPYPGTSGHYLLSALRPERIHRAGVLNACDVDDVEAALKQLGSPNAVALGRNAYEALGRRYPGVPHPQFIRRFHHRKQEEYDAAIQRAIDGEDLITWRP